jgi:hypothetical protein
MSKWDGQHSSYTSCELEARTSCWNCELGFTLNSVPGEAVIQARYRLQAHAEGKLKYFSVGTERRISVEAAEALARTS